MNFVGWQIKHTQKKEHVHIKELNQLTFAYYSGPQFIFIYWDSL